MQQERYEKQIKQLKKELADTRKESARRLIICQEKDNDLKILIGGGGDVRELREMYDRIQTNLEEMEESGNCSLKNQFMIEKMMKAMDE